MATEPLDTLQLKIQSDASAAAEGLKSLATALGKVRTAANKGLDVANYASGLKQLSDVVDKLNVDKLTQLASAMETIKASSRGISGSVSAAVSAVTKAGKASDNVAKATQATMERTARTAREVADVERKVQQASAQKHTNETTGTDDREERLANARQILARAEAVSQTVRNIVPKFTSALKGGLRTSIRVVVKMVESIGTAFVKVGQLAGRALLVPIRAVGNAISKAVHTVTGLIRSIGRIALYRAIRTAIKAITQGLNEGIQNLYQWSLIMDRTFANSMDSIATSMQYLHNGFASMFSPLINYAAPIIEEITNRLVDFFNTVQQIFAALTGASTWTKAIRVQKQYADAVTDTGRAADKAMHQLMAFDELNVINSPNDSGSPGSGDNKNYGSMFETQTVDTQLSNWVKEIKAFFESGDFRGLGAWVGEKLNGLVNQWNAYADGFRFGEKIRHALEVINGFLAEFDFYNLGQKVAEWWIGLWDGVTPEAIIETIRNVLTSIRDFVLGFIDRMIKEWEDRTGLDINQFGHWLGEKLNAWIKQWKSYEDGFNLGEKIRKVLAQLNEFLRTFDFVDLGGKLGDWVAGLLDGITPDELADAIANAFNAALGTVSGFAQKLKERNFVYNIGYAIGKAFAGISWADLGALIDDMVLGIVHLIEGAFKGFQNGDGWSKVKDAFGELSAPTWFFLSLPIAFKVLQGFSLLDTILASLGITGLTSAGGLFTVVAGGLALALTIHILTKRDDETPKPGDDLTPEQTLAVANRAVTNAVSFTAQAAAEEATDKILASGNMPTSLFQWGTPLGGNYFTEQADATAEAVREALRTELREQYGSVLTGTGLLPEIFGEATKPKTETNTGTTEEKSWLGKLWDGTKKFFKDVGAFIKDKATPDFTEEHEGYAEYWSDQIKNASPDELNKVIKDANPFINWGGGGGRSNSVRYDMYEPLKAESLKVISLLENSDIPNRMSNLVTRAGEGIKRTIATQDIPGKAREVGTNSGESIKSGFSITNVSGKFKEAATSAINAFKSQDFGSAGRASTDGIRSGINATSVVNMVSSAAQSAINAFKNANWAGTGSTAGANLGSSFKSAFVGHAKATLMLQTAAGKPITQAYVVPYANGGFVQNGSLFLAGEVAGQAEMVGNINGRTGVASGNEITGIGEAVRQTGEEEAMLLRRLITLNEAMLMKDPFGTPNSAAGRWIAQSSQAYKAVTG